jgi:hypothetical protein
MTFGKIENYGRLNNGERYSEFIHGMNGCMKYGGFNVCAVCDRHCVCKGKKARERLAVITEIGTGTLYYQNQNGYLHACASNEPYGLHDLKAQFEFVYEEGK